MPEHSPLPWKVATDEQKQTFVADANGLCVLEMEWTPHERELADWNLIVRCVNMHDELVEFLEGWSRQPDIRQPFLRDRISALLAKAKGET